MSKTMSIFDKLKTKEFKDAEEEAAFLQSLTVGELRELAAAGQVVYDSRKPIPLERKQEMTGLDQEAILKVETNREKATLEEIRRYCEGLNLDLHAFLKAS
jgi:hypothetical protein